VAPLEVSVALDPTHIPVGFATAVKVGVVVTVIVTATVPEHDPLEPVNVYCVDVVGVTTTVAPDKEPGIQV
jgi:hypothetical protein